MVLKAHHLRPAPSAKKAKTRKGRGEECFVDQEDFQLLNELE